MDTYTSNISDYGYGDIKSSLLSLQFLEEISPPEPLTHNAKINQSHAVKNQYLRIQTKQNSRQHNQEENWNSQQQYNIFETKSIELTKRQSQIQPRKLFEVNSEKCCLSQLQNIAITDQSGSDIPHSMDNIDQSKISNQFSKRQSYELQYDNHGAVSHEHQLQMLKQLQEKAIREVNECEDAEQIKQNFELLFQKVYGIIQEIEQRNQKPDITKSIVKTDLKSSARKQLAISTRVIELSVSKENQKMKKKKFCNLQTEFDYDNESCDEGTSAFNPHTKTEENWCSKTPFPSTTRAKPTNLLSLSKQYPTIVSPKTNLNSARSERSSKSKGLTLVSAEKKMERSYCPQVKKAVKITLMQKRIVGCPQKKVDLTKQTKSDKKTSSFNPTSFFSARRVSSRVI